MVVTSILETMIIKSEDTIPNVCNFMSVIPAELNY